MILNHFRKARFKNDRTSDFYNDIDNFIWNDFL